MGMGQNGMSHHSSNYKKTSTPQARVILCCVKFSHDFETRSLLLEPKVSVKIGRSGPHVCAALDNAIFDCVVISRDHARMWYQDGRFYLQDTKSSNGTFVNNELIGEKAKESPPMVVYTNDVVQFGSAVFSPDMKSRLGSIITVLKLYLPDGREIPTRPTSSASDVHALPSVHLYQLASYLEEAEHREQKLRKKMGILQHIVEACWKATSEGWKSQVQEDLLLSKVEFLNRQVEMFSKDMSDDRLRQEMVNLNEIQCHSQEVSKKYLEKAILERNEAIQKNENLERSQKSLQEEYVHFKTIAKQSQDDLKDLGQKYTIYFEKYQLLSQKIEAEKQMRDKCKMLEHEKRQLKEVADKFYAEKVMLEKRLTTIQSGNALNPGTQSGPMKGISDCKGNPCSTIKHKFSVTVVNQNSELTDDATSNVEQNGQGQSRLDLLFKRYERIERAENVRVEKLMNIKAQLDKLKAQYSSSEDLTVAICVNECMNGIEAELSHILKSFRSSKVDITSSDNPKYSNEIVNNLKAENNRLTLKLSEAEETLKYVGAKKDLYQTDFKTLTLKSLETAHENEDLKRRIVEAHSDIKARNNTIFELKKKTCSLEKSSEEELQQLMIMKDKLREDELAKNKLMREFELCKEELTRTQSALKKSEEECGKLRVSVGELEARCQSQSDTEAHARMTSLKEKCDSLQVANEQLKEECLQGEVHKKTYQAAQNDFIAFNQKLFEQMCVIEQMQTDLADVEKERTVFADMAKELTEMKQSCALKNEENANLTKKIDSIQADVDPMMRYFMPTVLGLGFIFVVIILTQRKRSRTQIQDTTLVD